MSDEIITFALKNTLNEIKNTYPTITNAFIFKNSKILAADETTDEDTAHSTVDAFNAIIERANAVGGIETVTIHSTNGKANITRINNLYLTTITSEETDEKYVNTLTQVLVPIVLKLVAKIHPASLSEDIFALEEPAESSMEETTTTEPEPDALLPKPPVNQFIIDNLNGILAPQDTVRIDKTVIAQWKKLYPNKKIEKVDAETLNGKTTRCKFKPIKDSKHEGKGIIQIPEKIQLTLQTTKGELVMIKPVVK
ncbi:hypothetical protein MUP38_06640 [Candidatus Bathyarchaeota archaeon]|nr:hypothetical protein [Candidatus Bathyarchaeota archaeon]